MPKTPRRFGLLDAMILVAAIAIGLAWARFQGSISEHLFNPFGSNLSGFGDPGEPRLTILLGRAWEKYALAAPVMAMLAVGLVVVRFRPPGLGLRRGLSQPGASACVAVAVVLGLSTIRFLVETWLWRIEVNYQAAHGINFHGEWWEGAYHILRPTEPGLAVVACWSILALSRRMRCERSLIDRLGRLVAAYWIVAMVFYWIAGPG